MDGKKDASLREPYPTRRNTLDCVSVGWKNQPRCSF